MELYQLFQGTDTPRCAEWVRLWRALVGNRALSAGEVNRLLRRNGRAAGIERRLHAHVLRHSAAMLKEEVGKGLREISRFRGRPIRRGRRDI